MLPTRWLGPHLHAQLFEHLLLRVVVVKVAQINQRLSHRLVLRKHIIILHSFTDNIAVLVLHHDDLSN